MSATRSAAVPVFVIEARRGFAPARLRDLWVYKELVYFLVWRDIKVRYKQTALGAAWAVIQPLVMMVVFSVFFGKLGGIPSEGLPYPVFSFVALLPWQLFSYSLTQSSQSLVAEARLITKVYFPRLIIPIASVLSGLVDFAIAFAILVVLLFYYGIDLSARVLVLPVFALLALLAALAAGFWLSALNVKYRDIRYTLPFLTQILLFLSPVAYPSSIVPERWQALYGLNPLAGVIEGFRWALLDTAPPLDTIYVSTALTLLLLVAGIYYFRSTERLFADLI